jgi:peptide deformylase
MELANDVIVPPLVDKQGLSRLIITDAEKLKEKCESFDFRNPQIDPLQLAQALVMEMRDFGGIGLAAPQLGFKLRVFAMRAEPNIVCFNPRIVMPSTEELYLEEGCLSFPGLIVKVKRPRHVRVRFQDANAEMQTETYTGMAARVFQHELDHLDGILFYDRAIRYHKEKAFKKWQPLKSPQMNASTLDVSLRTNALLDVPKATILLPESTPTSSLIIEG